MRKNTIATIGTSPGAVELRDLVTGLITKASRQGPLSVDQDDHRALAECVITYLNGLPQADIAMLYYHTNVAAAPTLMSDAANTGIVLNHPAVKRMMGAALTREKAVAAASGETAEPKVAVETDVETVLQRFEARSRAAELAASRRASTATARG